jgi:hypothetical protein
VILSRIAPCASLARIRLNTLQSELNTARDENTAEMNSAATELSLRSSYLDGVSLAWAMNGEDLETTASETWRL